MPTSGDNVGLTDGRTPGVIKRDDPLDFERFQGRARWVKVLKVKIADFLDGEKFGAQKIKLFFKKRKEIELDDEIFDKVDKVKFVAMWGIDDPRNASEGLNFMADDMRFLV